MGLFSFLRKKENRANIDDPNYWPNLFGAKYQSGAGIQVTPTVAMQTSAVIACVRVLAETIASLPLLVYQREENSKQPAVSHNLYSILHDSPNPWQTSFEFFEMQAAHVVLRGNAYSFVNRTGNGTIKSLIPLDPEKITMEVDGDSEQPTIRYRYQPDSAREKKQVFTSDEIWHVRGLSSDGFTGMSPLQMAVDSIGLAKATETHGSLLFQKGARPAGVVELPGRIQEDALKRLQSTVNASMSGDNAHSVPIFEQGLTWRNVQLTNEETQFLETRQFQVEEIARIFRVPTILIGHPDKTSTYASAEQLMLSFVTHSLRPWLVRIEKSINKTLLSGKKYFAEFKVDGLLRGDTKSRYEAYAVARQNMWLSANEIRALENMNPIEGGDTYENPNITVKEEGNGEGKEDI